MSDEAYNAGDLKMWQRSKENYQTLKAIDLSIKKWKGIVFHKQEEGGIHDCPLCQKYFWDDCLNCPIKNYVGIEECSNTPYVDFNQAEYRWLRELQKITTMQKTYEAYRNYLIQANLMLSFLYEVRLWYINNFIRK